MNKVFFLLLIFGLSACGSSSTPFQSMKAADGQVKIDGGQADWQESRLVLGDGFNLGVRNDEQNLYLSVNITNQNLRQAVQGRGLAIWLGENEDGEKINGLKYPVGRRAGQGRTARIPGQAQGQERNREARQAAIEESMSKIEFLPDATMGREMNVSNVENIKLAWEASQGELFYEIAVPLNSSIAEIINLNKSPGDEIKVLVELPQIQRREGAQARGRGNRGGGQGRGRGARQGGGRVGQGGGQGRNFRTVEFQKSVVVTLAQ